MTIDFESIPVYYSHSQEPRTFAKIDRHFPYPGAPAVILSLRWLIRPRTELSGFTARTFVDTRPLGLHQLVLLCHLLPFAELSPLLTDISNNVLTPLLTRHQNNLPRVKFKDSSGLNCCYNNLLVTKNSLHSPRSPLPAVIDDPDDSLPPPKKDILTIDNLSKHHPEIDINQSIIDFFNKK